MWNRPFAEISQCDNYILLKLTSKDNFVSKTLNKAKLLVLFTLTVLLGSTASVIVPNSSYAEDHSFEHIVGFWIVNEDGSFLNSFTSKSGNFWEIKEKGGALEIYIPSRKAVFKNIRPKGSKIQTSYKLAGDNNQQAKKFSVDIIFSEFEFRGKLRVPSGSYSVVGKLSDTFRQHRKQIALLKGKEKGIKNQIALLTQSTKNQIAILTQKIYELEDSNKLLKNDLSRSKKSSRVTKANYNKKIKNLENQKKKIAAEIDKILESPPQIDVSHIPSSFRIRFDTELKAEPRKKGRNYFKLKADDPVIFIYEDSGAEWALIATTDGYLGYIPSPFLEESRKSVRTQPTAPTQPLPKTKKNEASKIQPGATKTANTAITILEPNWDPGQIGSRMSIDAAGFMTLSGAIRTGQPVQSLKVNQKVVSVSGDGNFQTFINIETSQRMEIIAVLSDGRSEKLTFDLIVRSP
jgi:hypothetical protein